MKAWHVLVAALAAAFLFGYTFGHFDARVMCVDETANEAPDEQ